MWDFPSENRNMANVSDGRSKKQHKKRHGGESGRKQPKGGKNEPHRHFQVQKDEDTIERGKFSRRKIESNWSRYEEVAEGEVSGVASVGGAVGDEESSAAVVREDEGRTQQEDLRFKQLVESAKHRMPISEGASEASNSFSSDLFQINVSSLAESMQNTPRNERLLMDKGLLVEAGLMEADSPVDGNLKKLTLSQLRQHKSEDAPSRRADPTNMRFPQRLVPPAKTLPVDTDGLPRGDPLLRQSTEPITSVSTQSTADSHTQSVTDQPSLDTRPQKHSPQIAFQEQSPAPDTSSKAVNSDPLHPHGSSTPPHTKGLNSVGGVVPTMPTEISMSLRQPPPGTPGSQHKMVELVRDTTPRKKKVDSNNDDDQLDAMLDELLTL